MRQQLSLDEALISLNNTLDNEAVKLLYKLEECQGCPMMIIKEIPRMSKFDFKVTAKYPVDLQLRDNNTGGYICEWKETFNDRGQYALDIIKTTSGKNNCTFTIIDEGNCQLCPIAVLLFAIFILSGLEVIFKFAYGRVMKKASVGGASKYKDANINDDDVGEHENQTKEDRNQDLNGVKYIEESQMGEEPPQQVATQSVDNNEAPTTATIQDDQIRRDTSSQEDMPGVLKQESSSRVESLDIFRGLTIAGMIFVNYGGAGYVFFEHSVWDGATLADFVFPFFIFILGLSVPISISSSMKRNIPAHMVIRRILRRSMLLLLIGLCLNSQSLEGGDVQHLRIPGVLQRFSISYLAVAITHYISSLIQRRLSQSYPRQINHLTIFSSGLEIFVSLGWLGIYLYYTLFWEYDSSCPIGYTGPGGISDEGLYYNCTGGAASYIDRYFLGQNFMYHDHEVRDMYLTNISHDPEGLLGCSTSILLAMIGLQFGKILLGHKSHKDRLNNWLHWILITGLSCGLVFFIPINKKLWSITYVTVSASLAGFVYFVLYLLIDMVRIRRTFLLRLLSSAGKNPLFLYIGHSICSKMIPWYFAVDENSHAWLLVRLTWATTLWLIIAHWMASKSIVITL